MKFLLCLLLVSVIGPASAQEEKPLYGLLPLLEGRVTYRATENVPGLSREVIYRRARRWFVESFRTSNYVLQLQDRDSGEIVGKGISVAGIPYRRAILVDCKDGRYRITVTEVTISPGGVDIPIESDKYSRYYSKSNFEDYVKAIHEDNQATIESLKAAIASSKNEDY